MIVYVLISLGAMATVVADYMAKRWSLTHGWEWIAAVLLYACTGCIFVYALRYGELTVVNATWSVLVFVITSCIGLIIFHERLSTVQMAALILGFSSIALFVIDEIWGAGASIR